MPKWCTVYTYNMGASYVLSRLFVSGKEQQQQPLQKPKREARKRWSLPIKRSKTPHRDSVDVKVPETFKQDMEQPIPKIVLESSPRDTQLVRDGFPANLTEPVVQDEHAMTEEHDMPNPHAPVAPEVPLAVHDEAAPRKANDQEPAAGHESTIEAPAPPSKGDTVASALPPNGTPAAEEDVLAQRNVFLQHCQTLSYLKRVVQGQEPYVYSVRFRPDDFTSTVPLHALKVWNFNSGKVYKALEHARQVTWPHEVLEVVSAIVEEVSTVAVVEEAIPEANVPLPIIESLSVLLDALDGVYAKLLMWLDKDALRNLSGQPCSVPVVPSCELLDILQHTDRKLKKFIKCIAKDLSFVARSVCHNEMGEWDKILCDQNLDWEDLSVQLQTRTERHSSGSSHTESLHETTSPPNATSPLTSNISMLETGSHDNGTRAHIQRSSVLGHFVRGKDVRRQNVTKELCAVMKHPWSKRGDNNKQDNFSMTGPMFGRVSMEA